MRASMNYKNAWKCHECPQRADEEGCPCWCDGIVETDGNGVERVYSGCLFPIFMRSISATIKFSNLAASEVSATKEEIARGLSGLGHIMQRTIASLPLVRVEPVKTDEDQKKLSDG